ncbi:MAG: EAL domain-containing protein, partial [Pseudomonadales bacterium]|nr:EAL domain-containing protein [Pseudomonadales bacterium]
AFNRIQEAIEQPFMLGEKTVHITASTGIVLGQGGYQSPEEMVRDADTALHRAKLDAKGSYVVFDNEMYKNAIRFIECKSGMQQAIADDSFEVHYQPIIDVTTERLVGMEALLRWPCPDGFISPSEFIPVAEETGLILPLGELVLRSVCRQIKCWNQFGYTGFRVAVNLSARQFDNDIVDVIRNAIEDANISPESLAVEITEGIAMKNVEQNIRMLEQLCELGIHISLDAFGTGYSSLAYLKRFPITTLKIDRSFIQDITANPDDLALTNAIIAMGQNLKLKVLAEGVENNAQLQLLRDSGCDLIQGYYYSEPLSSRDITSYMEREKLALPAGSLAAG